MTEDFAIVTVRNSSSRLPNKAIMKIKDDTRAIDIVIERAKKTGFPVILATSIDVTDQIFVDIAKEHGVEIFRGSLQNKIKRWRDCFSKFHVQRALLIDGDDLSYDYEIAKRAMVKLKSSNNDMITSPTNVVCGFFTYAVTSNAIAKMYAIASNDSRNTDVITRFIELANLRVEFIDLESHEKDKEFRLTLDYEEDLKFFRVLYRNLSIVENGKEIIRFLEKDNSLSKINFHRQKDFLSNQARFNESVN